MTAERVVVVGGGHGGGTVAALLRQYGHTGPITIIGAEPVLPYERPPLSKAWLLGQVAATELLLRDASFYRDEQIDVRAGATATELDLAARRVRIGDEELLDYDILVLATGARARRLPVPGARADNVLHLRDQRDAARIRDALRPGHRLVVAGGGYIGLEVAAAARAREASVVVVERDERLLGRAASPTLARFLKERHERAGVEVRVGSCVQFLETRGDRVASVALSDGDSLRCDAVVVGVGAEPEVELAVRAGIHCDGGIVVDHAARTTAPAVYAIGDATVRPVPGHSRPRRLESIPSTVEQAKQAAGAITGRPAARPETPWFWSDQYDLKVQIAGLVDDGSTPQVLDHSPDALTVVHLRADRIRAVEAINRPGEFMAARRLMNAAHGVTVDDLRRPGTSLRSLAAAIRSVEAG